MGTLKNRWSGAGYDQEEAYFYQRDRELIEARKAKLKLEVIQGGGGGKTEAHHTPRSAAVKKAA